MSSPDFHNIDDLMAIADAVGVVAGPTSAQDEGKLLIHPALRDCLTGQLDEALEAWSWAAVGIDPADLPIALIPADPAQADREPPEDLMECEDCSGQGVVEVNLGFGVLTDRVCGYCSGTGERSRP